ncbi:MAG: response regulator [bacterium]|nr:response regulator [bacterium]
MNSEVVILMAEDNTGHARLITKNLERAGILNNVLRFRDGQEILDFLFCKGIGTHREPGKSYLLLLDIRMPRVDGITVLTHMKRDDELCKIPVFMLTTSNHPDEIKKCYSLGCSNYIAKPIKYDKFVNSVKNLGNFLSFVNIPVISGHTSH